MPTDTVAKGAALSANGANFFVRNQLRLGIYLDTAIRTVQPEPELPGNIGRFDAQTSGGGNRDRDRVRSLMEIGVTCSDAMAGFGTR